MSDAAANAPVAGAGGVVPRRQASDLPIEVVNHIFLYAANIDVATAQKLSGLAKWTRALLARTLAYHYRIAHVTEKIINEVHSKLTGPHPPTNRINSMRALAIDHTSINIYDDNTPEVPDPEKAAQVILKCENAKLLFLDTTSAHLLYQEGDIWANAAALTICAAHLPPLQREWDHMPFPPAQSIPYSTPRLHLCPLGIDALNFRAFPVASDASHLALTNPIIAPQDPPRRPEHEHLSRQVVLRLLSAPTFKRLIIRGSPKTLLRIATNLNAPPALFHFQTDPDLDQDELWNSLSDPEHLMASDRVRFRLWPPPDADSSLFTSQYDGSVVHPQLLKEWKAAAELQFDDEDAHRRDHPELYTPPANYEQMTEEEQNALLDRLWEQVSQFQPRLGAPWDDEQGDLCGISETTIERLRELVLQHPQYPDPPPSIWAALPQAAGGGP
ncbi:hypothetical protein A4X13_0g1113 [Tilletia indica]|uniref:Uncharacterized protein n=1 Tax=Tilletia indica TaxID=43049 RepID=A0A177TZJ0_9BASI|nr:hypothetical protein A4X13_0g1113 [Tilletia indica]